MKLPDSVATKAGPWTSLGVVALVSLVAQLALCQFFSFGELVPVSLDINPSNLWKQAYHFPPTGTFSVLNWLGIAYPAQALQPLSLAAADLSPWWFFTAYAPVVATLGLLAMAAFLRELGVTRPAAVFGGVIFAWQGDLLPFVYPGHYAYIATWPFFAIAAWGVLRGERTGHWAYALISGASCGLMVGLQPDRGAIASLLIGVLLIAAIVRRRDAALRGVAFLLLCVAVAVIVALAPLLSLFQGNVEGVTFAGASDREQTYNLVTQFSLAPIETLTYLVPGVFGWHMNNHDGVYWGWIGETLDWPSHHQGMRNLNLAISTTGTIATSLALIGVGLLLWDGLFGPGRMTERQRFYGRVLLGAGFVTLVLSWGWHTSLYRPLFDHLPLMDKWRNPLKWLEMTNFALVVLSAIGVDHLLVSIDGKAPGVALLRRRLAWFTTGMTVLLALGFALTYPAAFILNLTLPKEGFDPSILPGIVGTLHTAAFVALAVMALAAVVLRALWRPEPLRAWTVPNPLLHRAWQAMLRPAHIPVTLALALAALAALQLGWVAAQFIEPIPIKDLTETNPLLDALRAEGDTVRCSVIVQDPVLNDLLQNQFAAMNISCLDISAASRIPDAYNTFLHALEGNEAQLWFLAGVKNVVVPEAGVEQMRQDAGVGANIDHADGYTVVQTSSPQLPSHAVVGMKQYLAKATLVPDVEMFGTDDALLARLKDLNWNPRKTILLRSRVDLPPMAQAGTGPIVGDELGLRVYTPTQIGINVRTTRGGYVLVDDQYDPDWTVRVNGKDTELLRADYILRAVRVPAGDSTVSMHYNAHYHLGRLNLSVTVINILSDGAMLAAWIIAAVALRRQPLGQPV